jgi:hypothetical protein
MKPLSVGKGRGIPVLGLVAALALISAHLMVVPAHASEQIASLTEFSGTVIVQSRGDWGVKPEKGLPLYSKDKVVTRTGTAVVTFNDGAVFEIRANTHLLIEEQKKTSTITRNVLLLLGKVLFKTGKGSSTQTHLQTPTAIAGLRGTAGTLSIGVDGRSYIQFTEGGTSYTVGDFISGVAKDVPLELADLNPAQRAAFVAAAAADQAKNAAEASKEGKISDPQAALASAKAAEAAALEAKNAAQLMLNNPSAEIAQQAKEAVKEAEKAIEAARKAQDQAIDKGAKPQGSETYTPTTKNDKPGTDVVPTSSTSRITIPPALPTATAWVNWDKAVTGVVGLRLKGTFNPNDVTWQKAYLETRQFLKMVNGSNPNDVQRLKELNIPCIQVGQADLVSDQSRKDGLSVSMKDTKFFAYSTGHAPKIWATGNVTGTYSGTPQIGQSVLLKAPGLRADFVLQNWNNNQNDKWGANVNGDGRVGGHSIQFNGAAAGTIDPSTTFSGTGSGTVK